MGAMSRADREDVTAQIEAVGRAADELLTALDALVDATKTAQRAVKAAGVKRRSTAATTGLLGAVQGAASSVRRAEETYDLAVLDLATAQGEDA
jgi:predicted O-methyltransferase YrrM